MATNPMIPQGTLNRLRTSIVIPGNTALNITSSYMSKTFLRLTYGGKFNEKIGTATGTVDSPEPYVIATVTVGLLRTQALANAWIAQAQDTCILGNAAVYSDTSVFSVINLADTTIAEIDPGAFDGTDPVVKLTLEGVYYINNSLWDFS